MARQQHRPNPIGPMLAGSVVSGIGLGTGFAVAHNLSAPLIQSATRRLRLPPAPREMTVALNPLQGAGGTRAAVSANIRRLMREGYPQRQAVAIALEQARRTGRRNPALAWGSVLVWGLAAILGYGWWEAHRRPEPTPAA